MANKIESHKTQVFPIFCAKFTRQLFRCVSCSCTQIARGTLYLCASRCFDITPRERFTIFRSRSCARFIHPRMRYMPVRLAGAPLSSVRLRMRVSSQPLFPAFKLVLFRSPRETSMYPRGTSF